MNERGGYHYKQIVIEMETRAGGHHKSNFTKKTASKIAARKQVKLNYQLFNV